MTCSLIRPAALAGTALALACSLGVAPVARADLIAEESFVYVAGTTVDGQTGGSGWSGPWRTGQTSFFTASAAITGAPAVGETGGAMRISGSGRIFRAIDTSAGSPAAVAGLVQSHAAMFFGTIDGLGAPGTTVWVGMLVTGGSGTSGDETQYHFYDGARTDASSLALGDMNKDGEVVAMLRGGGVADWGFERTCSHSTCSGPTAGGFWSTTPFGGTHWSVTRYVFGASTTDITMWIDPAPGTTPPDDASAVLLTPFGGGTAVRTTSVPPMFFDTIAPNASGDFGYAVDEIRIGTTFADLSGGVIGPVDGGVPTDAGGGADAGGATDGGTAGTDAGSMGTDAGTTPTDSGTPTGDAGTGHADASADGGTGVASSGCGCTVPGNEGALHGSGVAVCAALGAACVARRRKRHARS